MPLSGSLPRQFSEVGPRIAERCGYWFEPSIAHRLFVSSALKRQPFVSGISQATRVVISLSNVAPFFVAFQPLGRGPVGR